jgi:hypothetical protein
LQLGDKKRIKMFPQMLNWKMNVAIAHNGWVYEKVCFDELSIYH